MFFLTQMSDFAKVFDNSVDIIYRKEVYEWLELLNHLQAQDE